MYNTWSLDVLYRGIDDPNLASDMERFEKLIGLLSEAVAALDKENAAVSLRRVIDVKEELTVLVRRLAGYFSLRRSADSADAEGASYQTKISGMIASTTKDNVIFEKFAGSLDNLDSILESDEILSQYKFYFEEIKNDISHMMSDEAEALYAKMNISGGRAWGDLFSYLTSKVKVDYNGEVTSLSAIRGLADSEDPAVRKAAFEAEIACYDKIKDSIAFALNSIKAQVNLTAELRGYKDPLAMTLEQSRMKKATLDAMLEAMREAMPAFRKYLRHKAKLLGYENGLPWYEILAPMGKAGGKTFTAEDSHAYLVEHFESFAPDLAEMVDEAFKNDWID
ncbi:MAG: peptidase M3, partial [Clostridia bacterium]|nr:peptidase M3 [Clostridia bacterium]